MELIWEPIPNQKKEFGRIINIMKCSECSNSACQYETCHNYALKTRTKKYKADEWLTENRERLAAEGWNEDMLDEFISFLAPKFPKGLYWESERSAFDKRLMRIKFVTFSRNGVPRVVGSVDAKNYDINNYDLSNTQEKYLSRFTKLFKQINEEVA